MSVNQRIQEDLITYCVCDFLFHGYTCKVTGNMMLKCLKYGIQTSMIRLNVCASWFAPLLFTCKTLGFSLQSWYKPVYETKYWKKSLWIVLI